jgi:hypothetical protein
MRRELGAALLAAGLACAGARPPPAPPPGAGAEEAFAEADRRYAENRLVEARAVLDELAARPDLPPELHLRALTQRGAVELEAGDGAAAEATLREALAGPVGAGPDDRYYRAKARFFLGEVWRLRFEALPVDVPGADPEALSARLDEKSQLLLAAQERYREAIGAGEARWAVAAGARTGELYETLHRQLLEAPVPPGLQGEDALAYSAALRERLQVLLMKAGDAYRQTLDAARAARVEGPYVRAAEEGLARTAPR